MGPLQLTDMIGQDINYAVTESVFQAFFQDPRFTPSLVQQERVAAGRLGRKSGCGFIATTNKRHLKLSPGYLHPQRNCRTALSCTAMRQASLCWPSYWQEMRRRSYNPARPVLLPSSMKLHLC